MDGFFLRQANGTHKLPGRAGGVRDSGYSFRNTILHFPGPHKLSSLLDEPMEYVFVQRGLQDLPN